MRARSGAFRVRVMLKNIRKHSGRFFFFYLLCAGFSALLFKPGSVLAQDNSASSRKSDGAAFSYIYKGRAVNMTPSKRYVAISERGTKYRSFIKSHGLEREILSDAPEFKLHGYALYRLSSQKITQDKSLKLLQQLDTFSKTSGETVQPVFEQGDVLMIPSDRLIVAFNDDIALEKAKTFLLQFSGSHGITDVKPLRKNTFAVSINKAARGRVFEVSGFLAKQQQLRYAEPDLLIYMPEPGELGKHKKNSFNRPSSKLHYEPAKHHSPVSWTILIDEGCESGTLPAGWITANNSSGDRADALWITTNYRAHGGSRSCYATGGGPEGVPPPGPYPVETYTWLDSPVINLGSSEEAYIEVWFYIKIENPYPSDVSDFGNLAIIDTTDNSRHDLCDEERACFTTPYTGDLTADPTTDNGWRRALFRIPPNLRRDNVRVRFSFFSRYAYSSEGFYIDQIRVVATNDVDSEPLGNDTYGARLYGFKNAGQIAGLGSYSNDMNIPEAWSLVTVDSDIIVAVVDTGIDLTHPDLNIVDGFNADGTPGGGPTAVGGDHGTAVAGNIGAIRNNGIGVFGTAPGVSLLSVHMGNGYSDLASAIDVAVVHGARVINNSWGWHGAPSNLVEDAIVNALAEKVVVLFAGGNGPDRWPYVYDTIFPANLTATTDVISVGASSPTDEHKSASSSDGSHQWGSSFIGAGPDVVAPSPWNYTTDRQGAAGYNPNPWAGSLIDPGDATSEDYTPHFGGTSSSTPMVAGIVALMLSKNPRLSPARVKQILRDTADDIDVPGIDDKTGAGRVNAEAAVRATPYNFRIPDIFIEAIRCFPFCLWPWILIVSILIIVALTVRLIRNRRAPSRGF